MSDNLNVWDALKAVPAAAKKKIGGGRLKGMTDIKPQWRLQMMTEQFGPIGIGWYYKPIKTWKEEIAILKDKLDDAPFKSHKRTAIKTWIDAITDCIRDLRKLNG